MSDSWYKDKTYVRAVDDEQKEEVLRRLRDVWLAHPSMRLGQLIGNVYHSMDRGGVQLYYEEDYDLIATVEGAYRRD